MKHDLTNIAHYKCLESVEEKKKEREAHFESLKNSLIGAQKFIEDCETRLNEVEI